jgi:hypothetical protein
VEVRWVELDLAVYKRQVLEVQQVQQVEHMEQQAAPALGSLLKHVKAAAGLG